MLCVYNFALPAFSFATHPWILKLQPDVISSEESDTASNSFYQDLPSFLTFLPRIECWVNGKSVVERCDVDRTVKSKPPIKIPRPMAKLIYGYLCRQPPFMKQSMTTLLCIWVFWYLNCGLWLNLFMQGEKKVVDRFLTFLILTRYRKICCNTNRRKTFETYKAARRGPAFTVLDCKSI